MGNGRVSHAVRWFSQFEMLIHSDAYLKSKRSSH